MEDPSGLFSRVSPETAPYASTLSRKDVSNDWLSVHTDVNLARISKANLLIVGTERLVLSLVSSVTDDLNSDVMIRCRDGLLPLPPASSQSGIVVLRDVEALKPEEQFALLNWVDSARKRRQVISTASAPLLPLVEAGAFDAALYYRLNTVYIDLTS
jgi:sigma-54-interacting transcriptional regulator